MKRAIRKQLIDSARDQMKTTWTYSQINDQFELRLDFKSDFDIRVIGDWLDEISKHEHDKGRPLLSALVVHQKDKKQGRGFTELCAEVYGKSREELSAIKNFRVKEKEKCYDYWKDDKHYNDFKDDY